MILHPTDEGTGLRDIVMTTRKVNWLGASIDSIRWVGFKDLAKIYYRILRLYITRPNQRSFIKETLSWPGNLIEYLGNGIYFGLK